MSERTQSPARKPIPKRVRFEVLRRDNHACRYCGQMAPDVKLTVDHVVPVVLGGTDDPSNLVAACVDCNAGKSSTSPDERIVDDVAQDALRWAGAMSRAAELIAANDEPRRAYVQAFKDAWDAWGYGTTIIDRSSPIPLPNDWRRSLEGFHKAGLPEAMMLDAVDRAGESHVPARGMFRYFCGICWRKLDDVRAVAAELITKEGA